MSARRAGISWADALVPSAKSLEGPPGPLGSPIIDHFMCYRTRGGRLRVPGLSIVDQFGSWTYDLLRVSRLCTAVDKRGEGIIDPNANLLCYKVRTTKSTPTTAFHGRPAVFIDNQFGPDELTLQGARELCVPSTMNSN